jgi:hypothetical protein
MNPPRSRWEFFDSDGKIEDSSYIYQTTTMKNHGFFSFFLNGISMGISQQVDDIDGKASNGSKVPAK